MNELRGIFPNVEVTLYDRIVKSPNELVDKMANYDEMIVVLPASIISGLLRKGVNPIRVVTKRVLQPYGTYKSFFSHFERVTKCDFEGDIL